MIEDIEIKTEKSDLNIERSIILIVDDDYSIRSVCKAYLESMGFETHTASSAGAGLKILNRIRVDLVITNIRMPGMDGLELTRLIKGRYDSDVIIMTG
jgi:DNA-binding NtrC family response regulator